MSSRRCLTGRSDRWPCGANSTDDVADQPIGCPEKETGPGTLAMPSPVMNRFGIRPDQAAELSSPIARRARRSTKPSDPISRAKALPNVAGSISGTEEGAETVKVAA